MIWNELDFSKSGVAMISGSVKINSLAKKATLFTDKYTYYTIP